MSLPYNIDDPKSIVDFAKLLQGKSLRMACDALVSSHDYSGKGNFGQVLEKYYFQYEPNSIAGADFASTNIELKSAPLKQLQSNEYRSKERLVLNIINYLEVVQQDFEQSTFWKKNANLLLVFYLHESNIDILDYIIKLVDLWCFPSTDLAIIKKDWELIKQKIVEGKAHELSEGDTFYLGACTKGSKGGNLREQPNSPEKAKQRAYSLKQGYVNHIIASIANDPKAIYGKLITELSVAQTKTIEEVVSAKFEPYYNKTDVEIYANLNLTLNLNSKSFHASMIKAILGIELDKQIEEFEKADIVVKTVRLKENNLPKEDISFPAFSYTELATEDWEESKFNTVLEQKFLFVFFQYQGTELVLKKVQFWNMPYPHRKLAEEVWERTKQLVSTGNIVQSIKGGKRKTNFPKKKDNLVSHVRPHAQNANDTYPLPIVDKVTGFTSYTKHCFWLNNTYVRDEIYLK